MDGWGTNSLQNLNSPWRYWNDWKNNKIYRQVHQSYSLLQQQKKKQQQDMQSPKQFQTLTQTLKHKQNFFEQTTMPLKLKSRRNSKSLRLSPALLNNTDSPRRRQRVVIPQSPSLKHQKSLSPRGKPGSVQQGGQLELNKLKKMSGWSKNRQNFSIAEYLKQVFEAARYSVRKLKSPSQQYVEARATYLNEATCAHQKFLFLDLDETLIKATKQDQIKSKRQGYSVAFRPHTTEFLHVMSQFYEIYVFTTASESFAQGVIEKLNKNHPYIKDCLSRNHCFTTKRGYFLKDLRVVKNRGLEDIVLLDNCVHSFGLQLSNGIPIPEFNGDKDDIQLLRLVPLLQKISQADDVRQEIKKHLDLEELGLLDPEEFLESFK